MSYDFADVTGKKLKESLNFIVLANGQIVAAFKYETAAKEFCNLLKLNAAEGQWFSYRKITKF